MAQDENERIISLFAQEVPEVAQGVVKIKAIARMPGVRTKVAILSLDAKVDAVGACVGLRGYRIKNIVDELGGERIDLVRWTDSPEQLITNALQPAVIDAVILDPARHRAKVVTSPDQASLANGRLGRNRELASRLCGWEIEIDATGTSSGDEPPVTVSFS